MSVKCETCGDEFEGDTLDRPLDARDELPYLVLHRNPNDDGMRAVGAVEHVYLCSPECALSFLEQEDDET